MSRIGKKPILVPAGVTVEIVNNLVTVKGPKGTLKEQFKNDVVIEYKDNQVQVSLPKEPTEFSPVYHGTVRALVNNMIKGVSEGFKVALEIRGTGWRFQQNAPGTVTVLAGYSNPSEVKLPEGVTVELPTQTDLVVCGYNKQVVGEFAAYIRSIRLPEPYHGKGIRYKDEVVRHKEGKTAK